MLQSNQIRRIVFLCCPKAIDRLHELVLSFPKLVLRGERVEVLAKRHGSRAGIVLVTRRQPEGCVVQQASSSLILPGMAP